MYGIIAIAGLVIGLVILIGALVVLKSAKNATMHQYAKQARTAGVVVMVFALIFLASQSFVVVDAGEIAVQVLFGAVLPDAIGEGFHLKNPMVNVVTYNIRLQEFSLSASSADSVDARTADNSHVTVDATILWAIDGKRAFDIYRTIAKGNQALVEILVRPTIRNALYDAAAQYPLEKIMSDRENYGLQVRDRIASSFEPNGLVVEKVLIRSITPPQEVDAAIKEKLRSQQALEAKTFELQTAQKNAEIKKAEARGIADAQDIIQARLTPLYVQYEAIKSYEKLATNPNTTFVLMPTSPNGTGLPIILGAQK